MDKAIVITTINSPREEIKKFSRIKDWQLVCIGDTKTPENWFQKGVCYLSPKDQDKLFSQFSQVLPWRKYARKNIGFLYAIKQGASIIGETDDDVFPYDNFPPDLSKKRRIKILKGEQFINIYKIFNKNINSWPRGFPLNYIKKQDKVKVHEGQVKTLMINSLIDKDGDFDAIYRFLFNDWVSFDKKGQFALERGCYCPVNTQNTFTHKEAFVLLYIPSFVNPHVEDIWRGYIAQRVLWEMGSKIVFTYPTAYTSNRNSHDYLRDFEHELPLYLQTNKLIQLLDNIKLSKDPSRSLIKVYKQLIKEGLVQKEELEILQAWVKLVEKLSS